MTFVVPYLYAAFVFYDALFRSKLLPPKGKRRELTVYFFRIGAMFLFLWMPTFGVLYIFNGMLSPWVTWGLGLFGHTQGLISALITMMKKDIGDAVKDLLFGCCRSSTDSAGDSGDKLVGILWNKQHHQCDPLNQDEIASQRICRSNVKHSSWSSVVWSLVHSIGWCVPTTQQSGVLDC